MSDDPPIGWHGYRTDRPYQICTYCVMDTADPAIEFDASGRCQYCRHVDENVRGKTWFPDGGAEDKLNAMIEGVRAKGRGKPYDLMIGLSGGADSSYLLYLTVTKWNLRPLVVHVDTGWNSEIAVGNIERLVTTLGVDLHTEVCDWETMQDLQRAFIIAGVYQQDIPQDNAILALQYKVARQYGIKTMFAGWNPSNEAVPGPIDVSGHLLFDARYIREIHKAHGRKPLDKYQLVTPFDYYVYIPFIYRLRTHYPLRFMRFDTAKVREELGREVGWRSYGAKHHESRWTRFYQTYYLNKYYGLDKRRMHLSSEIVSGNITRDHALAVLATPPYDPKTAALDEDFVMKKLDMGENEYRAALAGTPRDMDAYPNQKRMVMAMEQLKKLLRVRIRS
jgi:N-acetyl sugar amidotransferase